MKTRIDPRALTRELLAFNTINPPGMERACARHLGAILEAAGFRTAYHEFAEARTSLVAEIGGDPDRPPICFTGHIERSLSSTISNWIGFIAISVPVLPDGVKHSGGLA